MIKTNLKASEEDNNSVFRVEIFDKETGVFLNVSFNLWHDEQNIYWK